VRSNRVNNAIQIGRPGLRVGNRDELHLLGDYAYRYMITSGSRGRSRWAATGSATTGRDEGHPQGRR
jgi:predicted amidohydrolase